MFRPLLAFVLSRRPIVLLALLAFMGAGFATVFVLRHLL